MQIHVDGMAVVDAFFYQAPTEHAGTIDLVAGQRYRIKIRNFQGGGETEAHVSWQTAGRRQGAAADRADVSVLTCGRQRSRRRPRWLPLAL